MKFTQKYAELPRHDIKLAYLESGDHNLPTLVFIHGMRGNSRAYEKFTRQLKGFHLVLIDLPGYGKSSPLSIRHTLKNMAAAVAEFLEVAGLKDVNLVGYSFGGTVAFVVARYFPARIVRLILIAPVLVKRGIFLGVAKLYYDLYARLPERTQRYLLTNHPLILFGSNLMLTTNNAETRKDYLDNALKSSYQISPRAIAEVSQDMTKSDLKFEASGLKMPTLVIGAELDNLTRVEFLRRITHSLERVDFEVIRSTGHLLYAESPVELAAAVSDYLSREVKLASK